MGTFTRADQEQLEKAKEFLGTAAPKDLGFMKSLFFGRLRLDKILPYPTPDPAEWQRTTELIDKLDAFLRGNVDPDRIDREERISPEIIAGLGRLGILGMTVPTEYGGGGFTYRSYCRALEQVGGWCTSTAVLIGAHQSIGLKAIVLMGTPEQRTKYLPALASGDQIAAFCLSEPEVGSDAGNVQTHAIPSPDGKSWLINGEKKFATNAAFAGLMTVMARTPIIEDGKPREKVTAFIVTPDLPGFEVASANRSKCGIRGTWQATLRFTDMAVPAENVLGEVGKGLKVALSVLDYGRCSLSAGCVGAARRAVGMALQRAQTRVQFGRPIGQFGLIKAKIARMSETLFAMEALLELTCHLVDRHEEDVMLETAACKLFCSEGLWQIADDTMQIWGGEGYMRDNGVERIFRDARINRIVEGATEVMTAFIALIGMKGVGEELKQAVEAARHPLDNFGRLTKFARHELSDIVIGHDFAGLHPYLILEGQTLAGLTRKLARDVGRVCRTYREDVLEMQLVQQRIALSAVDLYAMAAVLSRLQAMVGKTGGLSAEDKRNLAVGRSFCHRTTERIEDRLTHLLSPADKETLAVADVVLGWTAPEEPEVMTEPMTPPYTL
jgi:acyl-CoA dehydrogenase family member 9